MAAKRVSIAALAFAASLVQGAASAQTPDALIVPGERLGPLVLGMTEAEMIAAAGNPDERLQQGRDKLYSWGMVTARIGENSPGIDQILINDPLYQTAERIHVGSAEGAAVAVLGDPMRKTSGGGFDTLEYAGMTLVERNKVVIQIRIQK